MQAYENLTGMNIAAAVQQADKALASSKLAPFFDPEGRGGDHWTFTSQADRSHNFHDHSWDFLDPLLLSYSATGTRLHFDKALVVALDWCRRYANEAARAAPVGEGQMAWYDMAVGMRAYRLAYICDVALHLGEDKAVIALLEQALEMHADYLADSSNIKFHNNHGLYQAAGQLAMGRRFAARSPAMAAALRQGQERFARMMDTQFARDGVHLEHSPDYHRMVHRTARRLVDEGLVEDPDLVARIEQCERALSWFVLPDGRVANMGDSDGRILREEPDVAKRRWKTAEMRYVVSGGRLGERPAEQVKAFEEGGYIAARIPNAEQSDFATDSYLLQQAAFHSRTHKHADSLSFIWSDRGAPLLVDAGRYGYVGKTKPGSDLHRAGFWYSDPDRIYCETTRAHNCLEFDGEDYPRKDVEPFGSAVGRIAADPTGRIHVFETAASHFADVRHDRLLLLHPGQWLLCLDAFADAGGRPHDVTQWFHFAPALRLAETDEGGFMTPVAGSPQPLQVRPLLGAGDGVRHVRGQVEPERQGWMSPAARQMVENDALGFERHDLSTGTIATLFCFADTLEIDPARQEVATGAGSARFHWMADGRATTIDLSRPESGALALGFHQD